MALLNAHYFSVVRFIETLRQCETRYFLLRLVTFDNIQILKGSLMEKGDLKELTAIYKVRNEHCEVLLIQIVKHDLSAGREKFSYSQIWASE